MGDRRQRVAHHNIRRHPFTRAAQSIYSPHEQLQTHTCNVLSSRAVTYPQLGIIVMSESILLKFLFTTRVFAPRYIVGEVILRSRLRCVSVHGRFFFITSSITLCPNILMENPRNNNTPKLAPILPHGRHPWVATRAWTPQQWDVLKSQAGAIDILS